MASVTKKHQTRASIHALDFLNSAALSQKPIKLDSKTRVRLNLRLYIHRITERAEMIIHFFPYLLPAQVTQSRVKERQATTAAIATSAHGSSKKIESARLEWKDRHEEGEGERPLARSSRGCTTRTHRRRRERNRAYIAYYNVVPFKTDVTNNRWFVIIIIFFFLNESCERQYILQRKVYTTHKREMIDIVARVPSQPARPILYQLLLLLLLTARKVEYILSSRQQTACRTEIKEKQNYNTHRLSFFFFFL